MPTGIQLDQLLELIERRAQIVEVLGAEDYGPVHLPGAISLPLRQLDAQAVTVLDRTRPVVVYCWDSL